MTALDQRHRWGQVERNGALITHTCRACGKTVTFDTLIPDAVLDALFEHAIRPNPYRTMFAAMELLA